MELLLFHLSQILILKVVLRPLLVLFLFTIQNERRKTTKCEKENKNDTNDVINELGLSFLFIIIVVFVFTHFSPSALVIPRKTKQKQNINLI